MPFCSILGSPLALVGTFYSVNVSWVCQQCIIATEDVVLALEQLDTARPTRQEF